MDVVARKFAIVPENVFHFFSRPAPRESAPHHFTFVREKTNTQFGAIEFPELPTVDITHYGALKFSNKICTFTVFTERFTAIATIDGVTHLPAYILQKLSEVSRILEIEIDDYVRSNVRFIENSIRVALDVLDRAVPV
jgi:hypothetical protein